MCDRRGRYIFLSVVLDYNISHSSHAVPFAPDESASDGAYKTDIEDRSQNSLDISIAVETDVSTPDSSANFTSTDVSSLLAIPQSAFCECHPQLVLLATFFDNILRRFVCPVHSPVRSERSLWHYPVNSPATHRLHARRYLVYSHSRSGHWGFHISVSGCSQLSDILFQLPIVILPPTLRKEFQILR